MKRLICPLIDYGCRMDTCAWWDGERSCCSVHSLAADMAGIRKQLLKSEPVDSESDANKKAAKN